MRKYIFFLAALIGLICFASCQKPGGNDPNDVFIGEGDASLFVCKVTPNVDFADLEVKANFKETKVEVFSMSFVYFEDAATSERENSIETETVELKLIEKSTLIDEDWEWKDQIENLKPGTAYNYYLRMEDFYGIHESKKQFVTKGTIGGAVLVTTDGVEVDSDNNLRFYGSVRTHFRALEGSGVELKIKYSDTDPTLADVAQINVLSNYDIDETTDPVNDTEVCKYHCSAPMMDLCWFQAAFKDAWGNEYVADSIVQYNNELPRAIWVKPPTVEGATKVTLKGNCVYHGAPPCVLRKHGFCYMEGNGVPTISDYVCYDETTQEWNKSFTQTLTNLKPNTMYSCRVFFKLAAFGTYYSDEVKTFTTEDVVNVTFDEPSNILSTSMELQATIDATEREVESCRFIWREINNDQDPGTLTLDNMEDGVYCLLEGHSFKTTIEELKPDQMYLLAAYIRMDNGEVWFSAPRQVKTKE